MHVYRVSSTKHIKSRYGDKVVLTIKDIGTGQISTTFAPYSYLKACEFKSIDVDDKHFFLYRGMEQRTRIGDDGKQIKYKMHIFDIKTELDGYNSDDEEPEQEHEADI